MEIPGKEEPGPEIPAATKAILLQRCVNIHHSINVNRLAVAWSKQPEKDVTEEFLTRFGKGNHFKHDKKRAHWLPVQGWICEVQSAAGPLVQQREQRFQNASKDFVTAKRVLRLAQDV